MSHAPRYVTNVEKALEAILWIVKERPMFDIYHIVKAAYFADKYHIQEYGRPICGDSYSAAPFGPLPQVMYGLLKRDPIEMIALETNGELPFAQGTHFTIVAARDPNLRKLSESDMEALGMGVEHVNGRSFNSIYNETHSDPAYLNAGGMQMDYRDFFSDSDDLKAQKIEAIEETAAYAVF